MPTYGPLGTTVRVHVWETVPGQDTSTVGDAACGVPVERISENYFDKPGGVDFLGPSSFPFYLVNAGNELFELPLSSESFQPLNKDEVEDNNPKTVPVAALEDPTLDSNTPLVPSTPTRLQKGGSVQSDGDSSLTSALTSIPGSEDGATSPIASMDGPSTTKKPDSQEKPRKKSGPLRMYTPAAEVTEAFQKPITRAMPIKIQVDFTKRTYMPSLVTNVPEDVCVNVFYNGEFVYSKLSRAHFARGETYEETHPNISGRRVASGLEVPFVVLPMDQVESRSITKGSNLSANAFSAVETWTKINQQLLVEADKWGRAGKFDMFRCPVGEYLEELSKVPLPKSARPINPGGANIGIIDVIISIGRTIVHDWKQLRQPQRKVTEARCGTKNLLVVVPPELSTKAATDMFETFQEEENIRIRKNSGKPLRSKNPAVLKQVKRGHDARFDGPVDHGHPPTQPPGSNMQPTLPKPPKNVPQKRYRGHSPDPEVNSATPLAHSPYSTRSKVQSIAYTDETPESTQAVVRGRARSVTQTPTRLRAGSFRLQLDGADSLSPTAEENNTYKYADVFGPALIGSQVGFDSMNDFASKPREARPRRRSRPPNDGSTDFGLDGSGVIRSKRKRASSGATTTVAAEDPIAAPKAKVPRVRTNGTGKFGPNATQQPPSSAFGGKTHILGEPGSDRLSTVEPTTSIESLSRHPTPDQDMERHATAVAVKKQRAPGRSMSARELNHLLEPHKPSLGVDTSFGHSFTEASSTRSTRNSSRHKSESATGENEVKRLPSSSRRVNAEMRVEGTRLLFVLNNLRYVEDHKGALLGVGRKSKPGAGSSMAKGLGKTLEVASSTRTLISLAAVSNQDMPARQTRAKHAKDGGELSYLPMYPPMDGVAQSMQLEDKTSVRAQSSKGSRSHPYVSIQPSEPLYLASLPQSGRQARQIRPNTGAEHENKHLKPIITPESATRGTSHIAENVNPSSGRPSASHRSRTKPHLTIQPILANVHTSRSYSRSSTGAKTPTPRSGTFPPLASAKQGARDISPIMMQSMVDFTPERPSKASSRPFRTRRSSSPTPLASTVSYSQSKNGRETPIPPPASRRQNTIPVAETENNRTEQSSEYVPTLVSRTKHHEVLPSQPASAVSSFASAILLPLAPSPRKKKATPAIKPQPLKNVEDKTPSNIWKPKELCKNSVLSYATQANSKDISGLMYEPAYGNICRRTKIDRDGVFRASGILMGVRYVFGLDSVEGSK